MPNTNLALVIVVGSLLAACFQANKPLDSTQTGNPPVIDLKRVALYLTSDASRVGVIGEPGAIEPGGAEVEVTNLRTGKSFTTRAASDGSFKVVVTGSEHDTYSVRATAAGATTPPVFVIRGNAAVGDGRDGSLSCEQRNTLAGELLTQASKTADRSCKVDADCAPIVARASCYAPGCWYAYVSKRGRGEIERVGREIDANLCADYEVDDCSHPLPKCAEAPAAVCSMGQCSSAVASVPDDPASCNSLSLGAAKRLNDAVRIADRFCNKIDDCSLPVPSLSCRGDCPLFLPFSLPGLDSLSATARDIEGQECAAFNATGCSVSEPPRCPDDNNVVACIDHICTRTYPPESCSGCLETQVEWESLESASISEISRVKPCADYERHRFDRTTGDEQTCGMQLEACNAITSAGAISTALAHPDVRVIFEYPQNPVRFGDSRTTFRITVGMRQIELGGPCDGVSLNCLPVSTGVEMLRETLQQIDRALSSPTAAGACAGFEN